MRLDTLVKLHFEFPRPIRTPSVRAILSTRFELLPCLLLDHGSVADAGLEDRFVAILHGDVRPADAASAADPSRKPRRLAENLFGRGRRTREGALAGAWRGRGGEESVLLEKAGRPREDRG